MSKEPKTAEQWRLPAPPEPTHQRAGSRETGPALPFKLPHRASTSIHSHTSSKSRDRYSSQKKGRQSLQSQPLFDSNGGDQKNAQLVKTLAGHYKEYCDEEERSKSQSNRGSHTRSTTRRRRATAGADEKAGQHMIGSGDEARRSTKEEEDVDAAVGIRALEELVGDYRGEDRDEMQNSFQKRIEQCEAYFIEHINHLKTEEAPKNEEDTASAQELMPGMSSKKQEQFLMKDSLSPSYATRARHANEPVGDAKAQELGGAAVFDSAEIETNEARQHTDKDQKLLPGARHQRLKTQIQIIEEEGRNRESLINQKDLGHLAPPNSEIKQKMSRLLAAAKKGGTSEDQHQQLSQHQSNNSSSVARFGFKSGGPSQPAGTSVAKGQQQLLQFDTSQRSTMMHQVTAAPAGMPTSTSMNEPSMNVNPVLDKSLQIPFQPMPSDDYVNFIGDHEQGNTAERLYPDPQKKQRQPTNIEEHSENDFDLSQEVLEGNSNIQKMINEFSNEQDYKAQNGALRVQVAEMSNLNMSLRRQLAQAEQLLRTRTQQSQDIHLALRKEKQRNEKCIIRLKNQQSLLRRLSSSLVSMGFSDLLNTILKEHRLEQPPLPTPTTYSSKHRGMRVAQRARHKGSLQPAHQNASILKLKHEYSSFMQNKSSASGLSLPPFTQFSQTIREEGALTEELLDFEDDDHDRYYSRRNGYGRRSGDGWGPPRSAASNNIGLGLDNKSVISEDGYYTRQSKTSYSCNSRHLIDRSRSSMNSRSRSRKLSRQYKSFHNAASRVQNDCKLQQLDVGSNHHFERRPDRAKKMKSLYSTLNNSHLPVNELMVKKYRRSAIQSNEGDGLSSQGGPPYHLDHKLGRRASELEIYRQRSQQKQVYRKAVPQRRQSGGRSIAGKANLHHQGQQYTKGIKQSRTMGPSTPQQTLLTPTNSQIVNQQTLVVARGDGRGRPLADDKIDNQTELQRKTSHALVACQPSSLSSAAEKYGLHQLDSTSNMADVIKAHNKLNQQGVNHCHDNGPCPWPRRIHDLTPSSENGELLLEQEKLQFDKLGQPQVLESNEDIEPIQHAQFDSMHDEKRGRHSQSVVGPQVSTQEGKNIDQGLTTMNQIEKDSIQNDDEDDKQHELFLLSSQQETVDKSFQQFQTFDTKPQESTGNPAIVKTIGSQDQQHEMFKIKAGHQKGTVNLKFYQRKSHSQSGHGNQQQSRTGRLSGPEACPKIVKQMSMVPQHPQKTRTPALDLSSMAKMTNETQNSLNSAREVLKIQRQPLDSHNTRSIHEAGPMHDNFTGQGDLGMLGRQAKVPHGTDVVRDLCVRQNILRTIVNQEDLAAVDLHRPSPENFPYFATQQCVDTQQEAALAKGGSSLMIDVQEGRIPNDGTRTSGMQGTPDVNTPGRVGSVHGATGDCGANLEAVVDNQIFQTYQDETLTTQQYAGNLEKQKIFNSVCETGNRPARGRPCIGPSKSSQLNILHLQQQYQHQPNHQNQYMDTLPPEMQMKFITTEAHEFLDTQQSHRSSTNQRAGTGGCELQNNYLSQKFMLEEVREEERDESYPHTQRTQAEKANILQSQRKGICLELQAQPNFLFQVNLENDQMQADQSNDGQGASLDFNDMLKLQRKESAQQRVQLHNGPQQPDNVPLCNQKPPIVLSNPHSRIKRPPISQAGGLLPKPRRAQGVPSCGPNTEFSTSQQDSELQRQRLLQERQSSQKRIIERLTDQKGEDDFLQGHGGSSMQSQPLPPQQQMVSYKIEMKSLGEDGRLERRRLNNNSRAWCPGIELANGSSERHQDEAQAHIFARKGPSCGQLGPRRPTSNLVARRHNTANSHSSSNLN